MPAENSHFITQDGTKIDIVFYQALNPVATIIIWPCMGGNARMYRLSYKKLIDNGYSIIFYNPRSHGESAGQISLTTSIDDIIAFLQYNNIIHVPLIAIGHSSGCAGLLKMGLTLSTIEKYFLLSPILDSRESLLYMYEKNTINEFTELIANRVTNREILEDILSTNKWLDTECWTHNKMKEQLDSISSNVLLMGQFFEDLCMPGFNVKNELVQFKMNTHILLPACDNWFPLEVTKAIAEKNNIPVITIAEAKNHFFQKALKYVWDHIDAVLIQ